MSKQLQKLDFDSWLNLSRKDPDHFEIQRQNLIAEAIAQAPKDRQKRLHGLQWRIEQMRRRAKTPMAACISISDLMWDVFAGENGLQSMLNAPPKKPDVIRPRADILLFQRKDKDT
ncbi:MAG: DUF3135 domain-containing protein [Gammaproteobacteria bacterium]|nr:DUF3135 domain-containing protein [Gammaproteobacteria bacterium]